MSSHLRGRASEVTVGKKKARRASGVAQRESRAREDSKVSVMKITVPAGCSDTL